MSQGVNLHDVVRGVINYLHPDVSATLYRTAGQETISGGIPKSKYLAGVSIMAQQQSQSPNTLFHEDKVGQEEINRRFYLFAEPGTADRVAGILRQLQRGGDMFQISEDSPWLPGTWWLVDAATEDFSIAGWMNVRATLQQIPPDFTYSDWWVDP